MLQLVFCVLLSAGILRELSAARRSARCATRCARRCGPPGATLRERELLLVRLEFGDGDWRRGRGRAAGALRRRAARRGAGRARRLRRGARASRRRRRAARGLPAPSATSRRRSRRSTSRCGTSRAGARARRSRALTRPRRARPRSPSTRRSAPRTARARPRRRRARRRGGLRHAEGQGRRRRRRRPARRGPRRGRAATWRSGSTPTAPGRRRTRRSPTCARSAPLGLELCEEPVHGVEALRAVRPSRRCRSRWTRPRRARAGSGAADAVCLKIAAAAGSPACCASRRGPRRRLGRSTSPRPSTGRWGSPPRVHAAAALQGHPTRAAWPPASRRRTHDASTALLSHLTRA